MITCYSTALWSCGFTVKSLGVGEPLGLIKAIRITTIAFLAIGDDRSLGALIS